MEIWDLLDETGNKTGKTIKRGEMMPDKLFHLGVQVFIVNSNNEFFIQKRSLNKKKYPNMWSATGGAVLAEESSEEACIRETKEEIGIDLNSKLYFIKRVKKDNALIDIWMTKQDFDIEKVCIQKKEVSEVRWANTLDIERLIQNSQLAESSVRSFEYINDYLKMNV